MASMDFEFDGRVVEWRGPAPFCFVAIPEDGRYLLPVKDAVRKSAGIELDDVVSVALYVGRG